MIRVVRFSDQSRSVSAPAPNLSRERSPARGRSRARGSDCVSHGAIPQPPPAAGPPGRRAYAGGGGAELRQRQGENRGAQVRGCALRVRSALRRRRGCAAEGTAMPLMTPAEILEGAGPIRQPAAVLVAQWVAAIPPMGRAIPCRLSIVPARAGWQSRGIRSPRDDLVRPGWAMASGRGSVKRWGYFRADDRRAECRGGRPESGRGAAAAAKSSTSSP